MTRAEMSDSRAEALFLEHLEWIDRISARLCRRHGLVGADSEDAAAWVRMRLIEDDYAALRRFRGESAITTYLTVVVSRLFRDYRAARWGRWRNSAEALRRGPLAVRLETLVRRDGLRLTQAAEAIRSDGHPDLSDGECARILAALPDRLPLRPAEVGPAAIETAVAADSAEAAVLAAESGTERARIGSALEAAIERLPPEDRVIVRLRFWQGSSVAQIARALRLDKKPLYRRLERTVATLKVELERSGVSREAVGELLSETP